MELPDELKDIRLLLDQRLEGTVSYLFFQTYILHLAGSVGQSVDVRRQDAVGSICDGGNERIRSSVATVCVVATNSAATVKLERAAQGGHVGEGQQRLGCATLRSHRGMGS